MDKIPVLSWARVSSWGQVEAESNENHELENQDYADDNNLEIVAWVRLDGISGTESLSHPEAWRMLYLAKTGQIKGVLFTHLTRFGRDMIELVQMQRELEKYGCPILSVRERIDTSTVSGLDHFYNLARQAEIELKRLAERVKRGHASRRRRGLLSIPSHLVPYGFQRQGRALVICEPEALIRREMFNLYLEHGKYNIVAEKLNARGYRTRPKKKAPTGYPWGHNAVKRCLADPSALGIYYSGRTATDAQGRLLPPERWGQIPCPQLVPVEKFETVQRLIAIEESRQPARKPRTTYGGLLKCHCGTPMYHKGRRKDQKHPRYFCNACSNSIRADELDGAVGRILVGFTLDNLPGHVSWKSEPDSQSARLRVLETQIAELQAERDGLVELFTAKAIDLNDFRRRHTPKAERQATLEAERAKLEKEIGADTLTQEAGARAAEILSVVRWGDLLSDEKRDLLRVFVKHLVLTEAEIEVVPMVLPDRLIVGDKIGNSADNPRIRNTSPEFIRLAVARPDRRVSPGGRLAWGYYIKLERKKRRLHVSEVARQMGVQVGSVFHWEGYHDIPSAANVPRIVDWLGYVPWSRSPYQATLAEALLAARQLRGLTVRALAELADLSTITINKIERGRWRGWVRILAQLEQALGMPLRRYLQPALCLLFAPLTFGHVKFAA